MILLCLQSVFETKIPILKPSPVVSEIVCVCVQRQYFVFLAWQVEERRMLWNLESNTWKPKTIFKQNHCSSLAVDKGKGWREQIRDKANELGRERQGDKILFTRKCRFS